MADNNWLAQGAPGARSSADTGVVVDQGLRAYMGSVYNYMAAGVALTGIVAYAMFMLTVTTDPALAAKGASMLRKGMYLTDLGKFLYSSPMIFVLIFAPLAFSFFLAFRIYKMSVAGAQLAFWLFAAVMGVSMSTIFIRYTQTSIAQVFAISAAMFGAMSLYGYVTKRDLSGWGTFLMMGMWGLLIASLGHFAYAAFTGASFPMFSFAISCLGVLVFAGFTAYDTQQIKDGYYEISHDATLVSKGAIMGALNLYIDFVAIFQNMLSLLGNRE
jgi:uncharacterized protein